MERKLTIVVGAGASKDFGLPTGAELKAQIAKMLNIRFSSEGQKSGDHLVAEALGIEANRRGLHLNDLRPHALHIAAAMPLAASIDNFIDTQRGNKEIELCGKVAITKAILDAERKSKLYLGLDNEENRASLHQSIKETWLNALFIRLIENCSENELASRLDTLSFIIFNYDRCVEHYLFHALRTYYSISPQDAAGLLARVKFFHPYGVVGRLVWQAMHRSRPHIDFGSELAAGSLLESAKNIRTFTEGTDPASSDVAEIKEEIATSKTVLFLGFAYHRLNLELLKASKIDERTRASRLSLGTAKGISDHDIAEIAQDIAIVRGSAIANTHIRNDLDCSSIFTEFARKISFV